MLVDLRLSYKALWSFSDTYQGYSPMHSVRCDVNTNDYLL